MVEIVDVRFWLRGKLQELLRGTRGDSTLRAIGANQRTIRGLVNTCFGKRLARDDGRTSEFAINE